MLIQFTLENLVVFVGSAVGIAVGIILLNILWNIKKMSDVIRPLVVNNKEFFVKALRTMPEVFENVVQIASNVKETTDKIKVSLPEILQEVQFATKVTRGSIESASTVMENIGTALSETVDIYKENTPGFITYFNVFKEIFLVLYNTFSSKK